MGSSSAASNGEKQGNNRASVADKKTKTQGRGSGKKNNSNTVKLFASKAASGNGKRKIQSDSDADTAAPRKMPRRAAACLDFKQKTVKISDKSSVLQRSTDHIEAEEFEAVNITKLGPEEHPPCRKLVDFIFHDSEGNPQPFEMSEVSDIFITSIIMPLDDEIVKEKNKGVRCEAFGRIENWALSGYDEGTPVIWISTETADYECTKPAAAYKKFYARFWEKACVCIEVFKKLSKSNGGNPDISLEELLAKVARSMSGSKTFPIGSSAIDYLISFGEFIFNQLIGLDDSNDADNIKFSSLPVLILLRDQCQKSRANNNQGVVPSSQGSLTIQEGKQIEMPEDEDEKLARLLEEEENWKLLKQRNSRKNTSSRNRMYIKINEDEMANDYPLPAYYKPSVQEMDEFIFFDFDNAVSYDLPTRVLNDWSLYNSDSRLISLELLPMKPCAENDGTIFGSGNMLEDDGTGFSYNLDQCQSSTSTSKAVDNGVPVYLSAIKEWMIEFGAGMIFISIRTDMAWYRLRNPAKQYVSWYEPVVKTARLAIDIIILLKEQTRVSKLSFFDVIKKVSEFEKNHPSYISSNMVSVERYVVVHAQIILQLFDEYPESVIRKSPFAAVLLEKMEMRRHTKLVMKKKVVIEKEFNLNPSASMVPVQSKRKVMRATTTKFINKFWGEYYSNHLPIGDLHIDQDKQQKAEEEDEQEESEQEENENEDEDVELEVSTDTQEDKQKSHSLTKPDSSKLEKSEIKWNGPSEATMSCGWALYRSASVRGDKVTVGGAVYVITAAEDMVIIFVEYMFETPNGGRMVHGRVLQKGTHTVLGNAANKREVYLTNQCLEIELAEVKESVVVNIRMMPWGHKFRKENADADKIYQMKAADREKKGLPLEYFCKSLYWPQRGAFFALPVDTIGLGSGVCHSCILRENDGDDFEVTVSKATFLYKKNQYNVHDFVYVNASHFGESREDLGTHKAGRNVGLKAFVVCQLLEIKVSEKSKPNIENTLLRIRRFYRPEDISIEKAYCSDIREVLFTDETLNIPVKVIQGKCQVRKKSQLPVLDTPVNLEHIFFCDRFYDPQTGSMKQLPTNSLVFSPSGKDNLFNKAKGKGKCNERDDIEYLKWKDVPKENRLSTLDIFAGCGGLSEGLQQSGVSYTKWAIEYEQPAGVAFRQNNLDALVFIDNCNVILRAIMEKCGDADDSVSPSEAIELAAKLDEEKVKNLPLPGEVDFINGGPPCQGFSGMNRFNQSTWSKVQCEMILSFLSFADYFRPRFFLLENVRNFVSFNKGQTFRLTLASLLEMGYQVRFGILEAGTFGVSQSRKRAFIWAASPEETLPEWPEPMHVFAGPELKVTLPGGQQYSAARSTAGGAPFRSVTVRDTIGDLPSVGNGASKFEIEYGSEPVSSFQKKIRGNVMVLSDHITKEMNELNLTRCKHIPCKPGADWRDLPEEKVKLSTGQVVDLIPWCLPNTADRHNQWKGLFGRLDWEGNFPTSITDPQPMGKVGMCFHPDQDRILTVREIARSQGFMDSFHFSGNIQNKYRQIGNAVPPPLAYALGTKLKEAVDAKKSKSVEA